MAAPGTHLPPVDRRVADHRDDRPSPRPARRPDPALLRRSLFAWAFTPAPATSPRPPEAASALAWIAAASVPVTALEEAATIRLALDACARTIAGKSAAATTQRRKRAVFHCSCTTGGWHGSPGWASPGRWPRSTPTSVTGTRSPGWCSSAAPRGWPCASPADERTRKLARRRLPPRRPGSLSGSTRKGCSRSMLRASPHSYQRLLGKKEST